MFSKKDLDKWMSLFMDRVDEKTLTLLQASGEVFVKYARESGRYNDQTGNLRSSIGYVILKDGVEFSSNFEKQNVGTEGEKGVEKSMKLARDLGNTFNTGYVLIGVAGMEYAIYVEAMESKDVITGAQIRTQEWMRRAIKQIIMTGGK